MPDKSTKHIPKPNWPIGTKKNSKLKVLDGDTQRTSWRQSTKGFSRDWDGDPISKDYNKAGLKARPHHAPHIKPKKRPKLPES